MQVDLLLASSMSPLEINRILISMCHFTPNFSSGAWQRNKCVPS